MKADLKARINRLVKQKIYDVALLAREQNRGSNVSANHVGPFDANKSSNRNSSMTE